jgi:hypothetical protein
MSLLTRDHRRTGVVLSMENGGNMDLRRTVPKSRHHEHGYPREALKSIRHKVGLRLIKLTYSVLRPESMSSMLFPVRL